MKNTGFRRNLKLINKINVAFVGHMGSGKSTVSGRIAKKLNLRHFDSDKEITKKEKMSIYEIFEQKNEKYFRNVECQVVLNLLSRKNSIISLGGGSILNKEIRKKLKNNSIVVFLDVDLKELEKRLNKSYNRPLLKNSNILNKLKELDTFRRKYYLKADIIIKNAKTFNSTYFKFIKFFSNININDKKYKT